MSIRVAPLCALKEYTLLIKKKKGQSHNDNPTKFRSQLQLSLSVSRKMLVLHSEIGKDYKKGMHWKGKGKGTQ